MKIGKLDNVYIRHCGRILPSLKNPYENFFVAQNFIKKGSRNFIFCLLEKVIAILRSISSTA